MSTHKTLVFSAFLVVCAVSSVWWWPLINARIQRESIAEPQTEKHSFAYQNSSKDDIRVELPFPGAVTGKTFSVIGKARGPWFFEASFPVTVIDATGAVLDRAIAQAEGEWMTTDFVPFRADIHIKNQAYTGPATLILEKDNPSGEPERDASVSFDIVVEY